MTRLDEVDRRILLQLDRAPRATVQLLAHTLGLARGTVQAHLGRLLEGDALARTTSRLRPHAVGRPLRALVTAEVDQSQFDGLIDELRTIPEVVECVAISGASDLWMEVLAVDADDVYRITQRIMRCPGISRTSTTLVLRELMSRRMDQLLR